MPKKRHLFALMIAASASLALTATPVLAATFEGPPILTTVDDTIPGAKVCGIIGTLHLTGSFRTWVGLSSDGLAMLKQTSQQVNVFTNPANGKSIANHVSGSSTDVDVVMVGPNLISVTTAYGGVEEWVRTGDGASLYKDRGYITLVQTVDDGGTPADPFDDVSVSTPTVGVARGQHPVAESGFTLPCEVIVPALS